MKKNQLTLLISFVLFSSTFFGQNNTTMKITDLNSSKTTYFKDSIISFNNDSKTVEILINVKEQIPVMEININGKINFGNLNVELLNPNGKKIRRFKIKIKSKELTNEGISIGEINKYIKNPELGAWKVKLSAVRVTGEIKMNHYGLKCP